MLPSVRDKASRSVGIPSAPNAVPLRRWFEAVFVYDGVDTCTLHLDDEPCAAEFVPLGSVRGIAWPYGVSVGAWPDADKRVFAGRIEEVRLWRRPAEGPDAG